MHDNQSFVVFPIQNDTVVIFKYQDFYTLDELAKLKSYKVKSLGVSVKIKHGGYVIFEEGGKGMVLSIADYPIPKKQFFNTPENQSPEQFNLQFNQMLKSISELEINGISGWRLPSETEFRMIHSNLVERNTPKCDRGIEESYNDDYDYDSKEKSLSVVNVCYNTYLNDNEYEKKPLVSSAGYLTNLYFSSSFKCQFFDPDGSKNNVLFNYDSTALPYDRCSEIFTINYSSYNKSTGESCMQENHNNIIKHLYTDDRYKRDLNEPNSDGILNFRMVYFFDEGQNENEVKAVNDGIPSVKIGYQTWMSKNLNVDKFLNGEPIQQAKTAEEWSQAGKDKKPAWCYYNFNSSNGGVYGKLYNWYAVNDPRGLAPQGWSIPSIIDFRQLILEIGFDTDAFKTTSGWRINGRNSSGLSLVPSGRVYGEYSPEIFYGLGDFGAFWTNSFPEHDTYYSFFVYLDSNYFHNKDIAGKSDGYAVRCIRK